jgi:hypothetical protein
MLLGEFLEFRGEKYSGVIHENVELAEFFANLREELAHIGLLRNVRLNCYRSAPVRRNFANQLLRFALRRFIIHDKVRAFIGKAQRDAPPNSFRCARHESDFA